jgi:hypothetical protein
MEAKGKMKRTREIEYYRADLTHFMICRTKDPEEYWGMSRDEWVESELGSSIDDYDEYDEEVGNARGSFESGILDFAWFPPGLNKREMASVAADWFSKELEDPTVVVDIYDLKEFWKTYRWDDYSEWVEYDVDSWALHRGTEVGFEGELFGWYGVAGTYPDWFATEESHEEEMYEDEDDYPLTTSDINREIDVRRMPSNRYVTEVEIDDDFDPTGLEFKFEGRAVHRPSQLARMDYVPDKWMEQVDAPTRDRVWGALLSSFSKSKEDIKYLIGATAGDIVEEYGLPRDAKQLLGIAVGKFVGSLGIKDIGDMLPWSKTGQKKLAPGETRKGIEAGKQAALPWRKRVR